MRGDIQKEIENIKIQMLSLFYGLSAWDEVGMYLSASDT